MAETIARIGKEVKGRFVEVTASVSNFVPKPHTPYQWNGMQTREYLHLGRATTCAAAAASSRSRSSSTTSRCSLLEGVLTRGDRRIAAGLEEAWRRGCRLDGWQRMLQARDLVADLRRPGHRPGLVLAARPADDRGAAVGPRQRQEGPRVSGEGAEPQRGAASGDGRRAVT